MNLRNSILLSVFIFLGSACQDVVQVKLDEGSELYVVDAFLESQYDGQSIFIHKNSSYFNTQEPEPVTNARVKLLDLNTGRSFEFFHSREDHYDIFLGIPKDSAFQAGHQYKLEITLDGFTYYALTTMPRAAKVDSISATRYTEDRITGKPRAPYYMCTLWAKDKADNNPDYYWIKTSEDNERFINTCVDGTGGIVKDAAQDSLYFTAPYNAMGFSIYMPGTGCRAEVDAITRDTYNFLIQAQAQINNGGMFATTPENVKTNFVTPKDAKKMVGWFSVANVAAGEKEIPNY